MHLPEANIFIGWPNWNLRHYRRGTWSDRLLLQQRRFLSNWHTASSTWIRFRQLCETTETAWNNLLQHVKVFRAAVKLGIPHLRDVSKSEFGKALGEMACDTDNFESSLVYMYSSRFGVDAGRPPRAGLSPPKCSLKWYAIYGTVDRLPILMLRPSFSRMLETNGYCIRSSSSSLLEGHGWWTPDAAPHRRW